METVLLPIWRFASLAVRCRLQRASSRKKADESVVCRSCTMVTGGSFRLGRCVSAARKREMVKRLWLSQTQLVPFALLLYCAVTSCSSVFLLFVKTMGKACVQDVRAIAMAFFVHLPTDSGIVQRAQHRQSLAQGKLAYGREKTV